MTSQINLKFWLLSLLLIGVIAFGTFYVFAHSGMSDSSSEPSSNQITIQGTIVTIDSQHGFTMSSGSTTYYIGIPYNFDRNVLNLTIGLNVTVTGYIVDSPMMNMNSYPMFHAEIINGITIEHYSQMGNGSGHCGNDNGSGNMGIMGSSGSHMGN